MSFTITATCTFCLSKSGHHSSATLLNSQPLPGPVEPRLTIRGAVTVGTVQTGWLAGWLTDGPRGTAAAAAAAALRVWAGN